MRCAESHDAKPTLDCNKNGRAKPVLEGLAVRRLPKLGFGTTQTGFTQLVVPSRSSPPLAGWVFSVKDAVASSPAHRSRLLRYQPRFCPTHIVRGMRCLAALPAASRTAELATRNFNRSARSSVSPRLKVNPAPSTTSTVLGNIARQHARPHISPSTPGYLPISGQTTPTF